MKFKVEQRYEEQLNMMEHIPCGILWCRYCKEEEFRVSYINEIAAEMLGFGNKRAFYNSEVRNPFQYMKENDELIFTSIREFEKGRENRKLIYERVDTDGRIIYLAQELAWVNAPDGEKVIQCTLVDYTRCHTKDLNMETLARSIPGGMAVFQLKDGHVETVYMNEQVANISGKTKKELFPIMREDPLKVIYPEDLEKVKKGIDRVIKGEKRFEEEFRILVDQTIERWVRLTAERSDQTEDGIRFYAVIVNITEQKLADLQLKNVYEQEEEQIKMIASKAIVVYKANLSRNEIELFETKDTLWKDVSDQNMTYDAYVQYLQSLIENEEESARVRKELDRGYILEKYQLGKHEVNIDYRRNEDSCQILWANNHQRIVREPETGDLVAFGYEKDIDVEMNDYTKNHQMMEKLKTLMFKRFFFIIALHYETGRYDVIQHMPLGHKIRMEGDIQEVVQTFMKNAEESEQRNMRYFTDEKLLYRKIQEEPGHEWSYMCNAKHGGRDLWLEFRVIKVVENDPDDHVYLLTAASINHVKEQEKCLQEALQKAEKAGRAKVEFLSHMSHEIRTPLNGIKGALDIMKDSDLALNAQNKELLDAAIISANHLTSIINDVLDMSKITGGKMQIYYSWIDLQDFVEQLGAIVHPMACEKSIKFMQDIDAKSFQLIYSDTGRLKQIFLNILSNAVKFTPNGGRIKMVAKTQIINHKKIHMDFEIADNGIGMTEEFLQRAFEPFEQEERNMSQVGTGLGMSITKQLVELLGGTFEIKSKVGVGTRVQIGFDFKASRNASVLAKSVEGTEGEKIYGGLDFSGIRCLIVEDNEINLMIAKRQLESMNIEVESAMNGQEAIDKIEQSEEWYYDIVFMDIMMPVKDGITATIQIRQMDRKDAADIPIVAMTANAFADDMNRSLNSGMNYHLSKPFDKEQIREVLLQEFATELE